MASTKPKFFLPYQDAWLKDRDLIKIAEKSRRVGLTYAQSFEDVDDIIFEKEYIPGKKIKKVFFSSADESAAKEYMDNCAMWARMYDAGAREVGEKVLDSDNDIKALCIEFSNGGKIYGLTSNPSRFRSKGGKIVLDEFAFHDDQPAMWKAAFPSSTWGYPVRIISSHNGKRTFFKFIEDAKAGKTKWSVHTITIQSAVAQGLYDKILSRKTTLAERQEWMDKLRRNCRDEITWLEEYCCIAQDIQSAYYPYELIVSCERPGILKNLEDCQNDLYAGWDIARKKDLAVVWVIEKDVVEITRHIEVFEKTRFQIQKDYLRALIRHPKFRRLCLDGTGMGLPLGEELQEEFGLYRVESVNFTAAVKEEMAVDVKRALEDRSFLLPEDAAVRESFHSIQRIVTTSGSVRFDADSTDATGHADRFWAGGLAHRAVKTAHAGPLTIVSRRPRQAQKALKGFLGRFGLPN